MVVYADPVSSLEAIEAYILRKLEPKEAVSSSSTEEPMSIRLLSAAANGYKESADASKEKLSEPIIDSENNEELTVDFTKQEQQPQPSPRLPAKRNRKVRDSFLPLIHPRTTSVYRQSSSAPQGRVFFFFNGERLSSKDTVFKFVLKQSKHVIKSHVSLEYQHVPRDKSFPEEQITAIMDRSNFFSIFEYLGTLRCMCDLPNQIFTLLKLLYILNRDWWLFNNKLPAWRSCLSLNSFITVKLSSKLVSQLQDLPTVASCNIPTWCYEAAEKFPFLFTFESRVLFMRVTAFGGFRGLNYLAKSQYAGQSIERERVFESFMKIVEEHFDSKTSLEIDFLNEVGSGLGPTLEFFTLCSNEFKRRDLNMWWKDTYHEPLHSSKYVTFLAGLFPKFTTDPSDKVLKYFSSLGTFCAKALADQRLVDILFSPVFWLLSIGGKDQIAQLCVASLADIDYRLFTSLKALQQIVDERKFYEKEDNIIKLAEVDQHVENMSISWSYPGHADVIMKTSNEFVSGKELEEYIFSVAHYTFFVGCTQQIQAFVSGWNKVCSIKVLQSFTPEEINTLLCGVEDQWDSETIISSIQPAHGYTFQSASVENFISIISSFDSLQRRQLLKFLTGSPRLPSGGLKSLSPPLTIVKKVVETSADDYLPSVMTCVNYLKLPDYSSKSVMQKKLLIAMYEGSESFHLS
ncbi:uncharacterized protein LOC135141096 [Zophobas morio]|uniref:uncharacterized protein LOC135141096 n=1 Tax=Zophobas morio TaxID=2755281 RepID=UPI0030829D17